MVDSVRTEVCRVDHLYSIHIMNRKTRVVQRGRVKSTGNTYLSPCLGHSLPRNLGEMFETLMIETLKISVIYSAQG